MMLRVAADKYDHIDFMPPKSVADAAEKGLEYRKKANPSDKGGLTPAEASEQGIGSGVQRATNLKNQTNVSPEVIRQMCAFFSRHEKNKGIAPENEATPWKDKGHVAWLLWGGDPGKTWAEKVRDQMDRADEKAESKTAHSLIDHELVNDLASAYRGKRMRDGIRDMEMAGMPEQVAERFYDALGEHADEVRGELHMMVERTASGCGCGGNCGGNCGGGCDCGCGADCPCMKSRVASRFVSVKRAAASLDPKKALAKIADTTKKEWEKFIASLAPNATGTARVYLESRPKLGGYGPYELGEVQLQGGTSDDSYSCGYTVKFVYDYPKDTFGIGAYSGPHALESLMSGKISFKEVPAHLKKVLARLKDTLAERAKAIQPTAPKGLTVEDVTRRLRSIRLGPGGRARSVEQDSPTEWTVEPSNRQRLDHYGNDGEGWDDDAWREDYANPMEAAAQKWLDEEFGAGLLECSTGEKGHIEVYLTPKGRQAFKVV